MRAGAEGPETSNSVSGLSQFRRALQPRAGVFKFSSEGWIIVAAAHARVAASGVGDASVIDEKSVTGVNSKPRSRRDGSRPDSETDDHQYYQCQHYHEPNRTIV